MLKNRKMQHRFVENGNLHYLCKQDVVKSQEIIMSLTRKTNLNAER